MPNSLKAKFKKMLYNNRISNDEYNAFVNKLDNHDKVIYNQALDDFIKEANLELKDLTNADETGDDYGIYDGLLYSMHIAEDLKKGGKNE